MVFIILHVCGFYNPPCALEKPATLALASVKSPKLTASPCVAMVTYSILSNNDGDLPPAIQPRVDEDAPPGE